MVGVALSSFLDDVGASEFVDSLVIQRGSVFIVEQKYGYVIIRRVQKQFRVCVEILKKYKPFLPDSILMDVAEQKQNQNQNQNQNRKKKNKIYNHVVGRRKSLSISTNSSSKTNSNSSNSKPKSDNTSDDSHSSCSSTYSGSTSSGDSVSSFASSHSMSSNNSIGSSNNNNKKKKKNNNNRKSSIYETKSDLTIRNFGKKNKEDKFGINVLQKNVLCLVITITNWLSFYDTNNRKFFDEYEKFLEYICKIFKNTGTVYSFNMSEIILYFSSSDTLKAFRGVLKIQKTILSRRSFRFKIIQTLSLERSYFGVLGCSRIKKYCVYDGCIEKAKFITKSYLFEIKNQQQNENKNKNENENDDGIGDSEFSSLQNLRNKNNNNNNKEKESVVLIDSDVEQHLESSKTLKSVRYKPYHILFNNENGNFIVVYELVSDDDDNDGFFDNNNECYYELERNFEKKNHDNFLLGFKQLVFFGDLEEAKKCLEMTNFSIENNNNVGDGSSCCSLTIKKLKLIIKKIEDYHTNTNNNNNNNEEDEYGDNLFLPFLVRKSMEIQKNKSFVVTQ